jgi:Uncharacterized Fe-S protein
MTISILSLHTYPVKSCGGITHARIGISQAGLDFDRQWVVVDRTGHFLTQRAHPRMALIQTELDDTALFLNAPEMPTLRVSLHPTNGGSQATPIRIWRSDTLGRDEGNTAAQWFNDFLGMECRLYRVHEQAQRRADPGRIRAWRERRPEHSEFPLDHEFGFADGFPFLVANQASLDDLNRRLANRDEPPVTMNRFRPNIVIQGLEAYEEDYVSSIRIGNITLALVKHCTRCPMPNVDPSTGEPGPEPMLTLSMYRRFEDGILFGVNAVASNAGAGAELSVGDLVEVDLDI